MWRVIYGADRPETARVDSEYPTVNEAAMRAIKIVQEDHQKGVLLFSPEVSNGMVVQWDVRKQAVICGPMVREIRENEARWLMQVPQCKFVP